MASISDMISEDTPVVQERWFHDEPKDCFYVGNFSSPRSPPHETTPVNMKWVVKHRYSDSASEQNSIVMLEANRKLYAVHGHLLFKYVSNLEAARSEHTEKRFVLPKASERTFERFLDWLYSSEKHQMAPKRCFFPLQDSSTSGCNRVDMLFLYKFSQDWEVPLLQDHIIITLFFDIVVEARYVEYEFINIAYSMNTSPDNPTPLCRLLVDFVAVFVHSPWFFGDMVYTHRLFEPSEFEEMIPHRKIDANFHRAVTYRRRQLLMTNFSSKRELDMSMDARSYCVDKSSFGSIKFPQNSWERQDEEWKVMLPYRNGRLYEYLFVSKMHGEWVGFR